MRKVKRFIIAFMILFIFVSLSAIGQSQIERETQIQNGWSSVDNVFVKQKMDILVRKPTSGPIKIGFTSKEVQEVMGVPDRVNKEEYIFYYRQSPIYFDHDWKVHSWDNRYGDLNILEEVVKIKLGSHILEVFKEKDLPLRITKVDQSYQLEYFDEMIYIGKRWQVEAVQPTLKVKYSTERGMMTLQEFIEEFNRNLTNR